MKALSKLHDGRIGADNVLLEISVKQYLEFAAEILNNNEFQRRRVKSSPTLYALLKDDLMAGCVIPSIVLALGGSVLPEVPLDELPKFFEDNSSKLIILDGLQRTSTMLELEDELLTRGAWGELNFLYGRVLRIEVYVGINRVGILYRMLTLNTGQTPMSLRQQVEILFLDFVETSIDGVRLIREMDDESPRAVGEYAFKSIIDGFNSYLERNELPIDRYDLLESVKSLRKLSSEDPQRNLFKDFLVSYHKFVVAATVLSHDRGFSSAELGIKGQPFGKDARRIFSKEQAIAGFGAAIGKLRDFHIISTFEEVEEIVTMLKVPESPFDSLSKLLKNLEAIRLQSKKIGNSQRLYFQFFFRELFNRESDGFADLALSAEAAYKKYESQML